MSDNRAHLEEKYTWDLTTIFATDADWENEYESTVQDLKKAGAYAGHLLDSAKNLLEATELYMSLSLVLLVKPYCCVLVIFH